MNRLLFLCLVGLSSLGTYVTAEDIEFANYAIDGDDKGHYDQRTIVADVELNFMRFNQTDGTGFLGVPNRFNWEATPRFTLGFAGAEGLGLRLRYWEYSHSAGPPPTETVVDTYNIDLELFDYVQIGRATSLEWSAGLRYNDFSVIERAAGLNDEFGGLGALLGLKLTRATSCGKFYGRASWAIMTDSDSNSLNVATTNDIGMQTEIGLGYELSRVTLKGVQLTSRVGYEVQYWSGYGVNSAALGNGNVGIGWDGVILGIGFNR